MSRTPQTPHRPPAGTVERRPDPFARNVERHDQMRSLAPANADHPADHMSPRARQVYLFDEAIIRSHPHRKES